MTKSDSQTMKREELLRYLFGEMDDVGRDLFDERSVNDDALFYEAADVENELIDRYATGKLSGDELFRFERSLERFPARRSKIANAKALQELIRDERNVLPADIPAAGLWEKLAEIFTFRTPVFGAVMSLLMLASVATAFFLYLDNRRTKDQLAELQNRQSSNGPDAANRELELRTQINAREQESDELVRSLGAEQQRIRQLESELAKAGGANRKPTTPKAADPAIASLVIDEPGLDRQGDVKTTSVGENTRKLAVNITLSDAVRVDEKLSIELNGKPLAQNVSPRVGGNGQKSITVMVPRENLNIGNNKLTVLDPAGKKVKEYEFSVDRP